MRMDVKFLWAEAGAMKVEAVVLLYRRMNFEHFELDELHVKHFSCDPF